MVGIGDSTVRGENINRAVKGFGLKEFKLRQVLDMQNSNKWTETYYRETAAELTAAGEGLTIAGVSRGAAFPHLEPSWSKVQTTQIKFGGETIVFMEDKLSDAIDVQKRAIIRVSRAIANSVDNYIYSELTAEGSTSGVTASQAAWDSSTIADRDPIGDILLGIQAMMANNYDVLSNGYLLLSPKDYSSILRNEKVINNPSFKTADVVSNGVVGNICGLKIIVSNSVTADEAMIVQGKKAATWRMVEPLKSAVIVDEGVKFTIRSWELGHIEITDPQALYTITNTQE